MQRQFRQYKFQEPTQLYVAICIRRRFTFGAQLVTGTDVCVDKEQKATDSDRWWFIEINSFQLYYVIYI